MPQQRRSRITHDLKKRAAALIMAVIAVFLLIFEAKADVCKDQDRTCIAETTANVSPVPAEEQSAPSEERREQTLEAERGLSLGSKNFSSEAEKSPPSPEIVMIPGCILLLAALMLAKDQKKH
jgi:hypothetical protein